jgi:hypothetical protein
LGRAAQNAGVDRKTAFSISKKVRSLVEDKTTRKNFLTLFCEKLGLKGGDEALLLRWLARNELSMEELELLTFEFANCVLLRRRKRLVSRCLKKSGRAHLLTLRRQSWPRSKPGAKH